MFDKATLLRQGVHKEWEVFIYQIDNCEQEAHCDHTYPLLVAADLDLSLVVSVTQTSSEMLARNVGMLLLALEAGLLQPLLLLLLLRVIETWLVTEPAHFLGAEKTEIKSHNPFCFNEQI